MFRTLSNKKAGRAAANREETALSGSRRETYARRFPRQHIFLRTNTSTDHPAHSRLVSPVHAMTEAIPKLSADPPTQADGARDKKYVTAGMFLPRKARLQEESSKRSYRG